MHFGASKDTRQQSCRGRVMGQFNTSYGDSNCLRVESCHHGQEVCGNRENKRKPFEEMQPLKAIRKQLPLNRIRTPTDHSSEIS